MSKSSLLDTCTASELLQWFGRHTVEKARPYCARVTNLRRVEHSLTANVKGTAPRPYHVEVYDGARFARAGAIAGACSCPVGFNCKHVAATLLAWMAAREDPTRPSGAVLAWLEGLNALTGAAAGDAPKPNAASHLLLYMLAKTGSGLSAGLNILKARRNRDGTLRDLSEWTALDRALVSPPGFVTPVDIDIFRLLLLHQRLDLAFDSSYRLDGPHADMLMRLLVASGRLYVEGEPMPMQSGEARAGSLRWQSTADGRRQLTLACEPAVLLLPLPSPWYVDLANRQAGPVRCEQTPALLAHLLSLPPLSGADAALVGKALHEVAPELPPPVAEQRAPIAVQGPPVPILRLRTTPVYGVRFRRYAPYATTEFDFAELTFRYGTVELTMADRNDYHIDAEGQVLQVQRDAAAEQRCSKQLTKCGFKYINPRSVEPRDDMLPGNAWGLEREGDWPTFVAEAVPALRSQGWVVEMPADFRHHVLTIDEWLFDVDSAEGDWLSVSPGIEVAGRRYDLAPLLAALFQRDPRWLTPARQQIPDQESVTLDLKDVGRVRVPAARIKALVSALIDLFEQPPGAGLRVSALDAPRLEALTGSGDWRGRGHDTVESLVERLRGAAGIAAATPPAGFALTLRAYQLEGLAWLQHLRAHAFGGILADDMGLGKTAQALAHLLIEKQSGRLERPALVVLPTSLVFNWQQEAERFAPTLRVLALHGPDRHLCFADLDNAKADVALTTYPLLWRDAEQLQARPWSTLILDEAQTVKNAASKGAEVVRALQAKHRLCLTGTPLENHLGELWSQFDFLLPGFLGDSKHFTRLWRTPIEKHGDVSRRALLAARIRPFILRRRKEDVAKELPPKSIIVRSVALAGAQRDLYETVRAAMNEKVRNAIAAQGFARSQIVILDALLKLRQICCDPRLLKMPAAANVRERAKLDFLMDMLPELVSEGRRILLFSQFTGMLALIRAAIEAAGIDYVILTGDTRDRRTPVANFQSGKVPLFLISLKAGGLGLNLPAADTVIHYDPWWNPAVENQATDRAHRIGQTQRVFVYKLICAGSIEERILALQEKKAALAAGVLSEDADALAKFGEADIAALLAPLPES